MTEFDFLTVAPDLPSDLPEFEDGLYQIELVGMVVANRNKYQSDEKEPQVKLVWQILGTKKLISHKWLKISLYEKATLAKLLCEWFKSANIETLLAKVKVDGKVQLGNLLGKRATGYIKTATSSTGKDYLTIASLAPAKAMQTEHTQSTNIPKWLADEEILQQLWVPQLSGETVAEEVTVEEKPVTVKTNFPTDDREPASVEVDVDENEDLPF